MQQNKRRNRQKKINKECRYNIAKYIIRTVFTDSPKAVSGIIMKFKSKTDRFFLRCDVVNLNDEKNERTEQEKNNNNL